MKSDIIKLNSVMTIDRTSANKYNTIDEKPKYDAELGPVFSLTPTFGNKVRNSQVVTIPDKSQPDIALSCKNDIDLEKKSDSGIPEALFPGCGIVMTLLSSVFFSISTACVKEGAATQAGMNGVEIAFFRGIILSVITGVFQLTKGENLYVPKDEIIINFLRGLFGSFAVFGLYMSMRYITLADASAISFSSPIWTFILSFFILKERMHWVQLFSLPASIFGVVMIAHPDLFAGVDGPEIPVTTEQLLNDGIVYPDTLNSTSLLTTNNITFSNVKGFADNTSLLGARQDFSTNSSERIYGIMMAIVSSLSMAATFIVLKFRKKTPVQTVIFWFGLTTSAIALAMMPAFSGFVWPASFKIWLLILGNGSFSWLGQALFQVAFYFEDATIISLMRTMDVVMAFIISAIFLDEYIEWTSIIGASIIVASVTSLVLLKWYKSVKGIQ